jgi:hypothetical protein
MNAVDKVLEQQSLASKALLIKLVKGTYQPYVHDGQATTQVEATNGVSKVGRFNKRLFRDCFALDEANKAFNAVYNYHMKHTLPWLDDGMRILPSTLYFEYTQELRALIDEANKAADALDAVWADEVQKDLVRLGPLGKLSDYPTSVRDKFYITVRFLPVPTTTDFRVHISDADRESLNQAIKDAETTVTKHIMTELMEPVKRLAQRCNEFSGESSERWHHSLVLNVQAVAERMGKLNVTDDETIDRFIADVNMSITAYAAQPDLLKEDPAERAVAYAKLEELNKRMAAFMGGHG